MVYDRQRRGPALVGTNPAVNLTRERANHIAQSLIAQSLMGELQDLITHRARNERPRHVVGRAAPPPDSGAGSLGVRRPT